MNIQSKEIGIPKWRATRRAAVDFMYKEPLSRRMKESYSWAESWLSLSTSSPSSDCREAKRNKRFESCLTTKSIEALHKLHTPSKKIIRSSSVFMSFKLATQKGNSIFNYLSITPIRGASLFRTIIKMGA